MRVNCLDCLDRTNAVQSFLGLEVRMVYLIHISENIGAWPSVDVCEKRQSTLCRKS